jgi:hypothetical protein
MKTPHLDKFPSLLLITNNETNTVEYSNQYADDLLGISIVADNDIGLFSIITKATSILFESYIRPILLKDGQCTEIQIALLDKISDKIPAVANIKLLDSKFYWSINIAKARDKLY